MSYNGARTKTATILEPDKVQAVSDALPIFVVEVGEFPNGIVVDKVYLKTSVLSSYTVNVEKWSSPTDAVPDTIVSVATVASTEAEAAPSGANGNVGTSEIIMLDLPVDAVAWITFTMSFYMV